MGGRCHQFYWIKFGYQLCGGLVGRSPRLFYRRVRRNNFSRSNVEGDSVGTLSPVKFYFNRLPVLYLLQLPSLPVKKHAHPVISLFSPSKGTFLTPTDNVCTVCCNLFLLPGISSLPYPNFPSPTPTPLPIYNFL